MKPDWNKQGIACVQPTLPTPAGKDKARSVITEGESKGGGSRSMIPWKYWNLEAL